MADVRPDPEPGARSQSRSTTAGDNQGVFSARSPEDPMRAIWQQHRAEVFERVGLIERAVSALTAAELDEQLRVDARRAAHQLIGSVGTFGFIRASETARELELALTDPAPARAQAMSRLIAIVRRELAQGERGIGAAGRAR